VPVGRLIRPGEPGATLLEDTQAALMPDSLRGFQTIPGLTRPAPAPDNSLYNILKPVLISIKLQIMI